MEVEAEGFAPFRGPLTEQVRLELASPRQSLTVTATRSSAEDLYSIAPAATNHEVGRLTSLAGHMAGSPSVLLQQTGPSQASPFLRGLTGYQVSNLVDGVRPDFVGVRRDFDRLCVFVDVCDTSVLV